MAHRRSRLRPARLVLLALLASLAWCVLSLFASSPSASADDGSSRGSGLLGAVGETLESVGGTLEQTVAGVDAAVAAVTTAVAPVAEPVVAPVPEPVSEPVVAVVQTATTTADSTVGATDAAIVAGIDAVASSVTEVAQAAPASDLVAPAVTLTSQVPVVADVLDRTRAGDALTGIAEGADAAVSALIGSAPPTAPLIPDLPLSGLAPVTDALTAPGPVLLPGLPLPGRVLPDRPSVAGDGPLAALLAAPGPPEALRVDAASADRGTSVSTLDPAASAASRAAERTGAPGLSGALAGSSASLTAGGGSGGVAALGAESAPHSATGASSVRLPADEALPGAPVYDTDVSPD